MRVSCALSPSSSTLPTPRPPERTTGRVRRLPSRARRRGTSSRRTESISSPQREPSGNDPAGGAASLWNVNAPRQQENARSSRNAPCSPSSRCASAAGMSCSWKSTATTSWPLLAACSSAARTFSAASTPFICRKRRRPSSGSSEATCSGVPRRNTIWSFLPSSRSKRKPPDAALSAVSAYRRTGETRARSPESGTSSVSGALNITGGFLGGGGGGSAGACGATTGGAGATSRAFAASPMPNASAIALLIRGPAGGSAAVRSSLRAGVRRLRSSGKSAPGSHSLPSIDASQFSVSWPRSRSRAEMVNGPQIRPCSVRTQ